ncbi:MAG: hypothetical protein ACXWMO_08325 [Syntrophales bacterium]
MPSLIDGEVDVTKVGIRLPQSLELDVVVRSSNSRGKGSSSAAGAVATKFVWIKLSLLGKGSNKGSEVGVSDPCRGSVREEGE